MGAPSRTLTQALVIRPALKGLLGFNLYRRERLPRSGPAIIVANHNSHLDAFVLMALFPLGMVARVHAVAAADYFLRNGLCAWAALKLIGVIPLKRGPHSPSAGDPLAPCSEALDRGDILIVFPEGTRGAPERIAKFRPGIAHLAERHPEVPVIPVFLEGLGRALPKGSLVPVPAVCTVVVGRALYWDGDRRAFMERLQGRIATLSRQRPAPFHDRPVDGPAFAPRLGSALSEKPVALRWRRAGSPAVRLGPIRRLIRLAQRGQSA